MAIQLFVDFYRKIGCPHISTGRRIEVQIIASDDVVSACQALSDENIGRFLECIVEEQEINVSELTVSNRAFSFVYQLAGSDSTSVFKDMDELVARNESMKSGEDIGDFYLWHEDYLRSEHQQGERSRNLSALCKMVRGLSALAHYHNVKEKGHSHELVFLKDIDSLSTGITVIQPNFSKSIIDGKLLNVEVFEELTEGNINPHLAREQGVFRASIIEFLATNSGSSVERFDYLVIHWEAFLALFKNNFETYLSGFAFHKAKQEVAEAELTISEQVSKIVNENTGKLLGIPLSFAGLVALVKASSFLEELIISVGLLIASIIVSELVHNQKAQLERVEHARDTKFSSFAIRKTTYPKDLRVALDRAQSGISASCVKLKRSLYLFIILCWLPPLFMTLYLSIKYNAYLYVSGQWLLSTFKQLFTIFC